MYRERGGEFDYHNASVHATTMHYCIAFWAFHLPASLFPIWVDQEVKDRRCESIDLARLCVRAVMNQPVKHNNLTAIL